VLEDLYQKYGEDFPWWEPEDMTPAERQLQREVTAGHPLYGRALRGLARSGARDDVLFTDGEQYVLVHLTWGVGNADYPRFQLFDTAAEAMAAIEREISG